MKSLFLFGMLLSLPLFAAESTVSSLAVEAAAFQRMIDDPAYVEKGRDVLRAAKLVLDNRIAAKIAAKDCEELRRAEPTLTSGIYNLYPRGEKVGMAGVYCEVSANKTDSKLVDYPGYACEITQASCPKHPESRYVGTFVDREADADWNKEACLARATDYGSWCGNQLSTAKFYVDRKLAGERTYDRRPCRLPWGGELAFGQSVVATAQVRIGGHDGGVECRSQKRVCGAGAKLSGSYTGRASCASRATPAPAERHGHD